MVPPRNSVNNLESPVLVAQGFPKGWYYSVVCSWSDNVLKSETYWQGPDDQEYRSFKRIEDGNPGIVLDKEAFQEDVAGTVEVVAAIMLGEEDLRVFKMRKRRPELTKGTSSTSSTTPERSSSESCSLSKTAPSSRRQQEHTRKQAAPKVAAKVAPKPVQKPAPATAIKPAPRVSSLAPKYHPSDPGARHTWSTAENNVLRNTLLKFGKDWERIEALFPFVSVTAVKKKVHSFIAGENLLNEVTKAGASNGLVSQRTWLDKEDTVLRKALLKFGKDWERVASKLDHRSLLAVKARGMMLISEEKLDVRKVEAKEEKIEEEREKKKKKKKEKEKEKEGKKATGGCTENTEKELKKRRAQELKLAEEREREKDLQRKVELQREYRSVVKTVTDKTVFKRQWKILSNKGWHYTSGDSLSNYFYMEPGGTKENGRFYRSEDELLDSLRNRGRNAEEMAAYGDGKIRGIGRRQSSDNSMALVLNKKAETKRTDFTGTEKVPYTAKDEATIRRFLLKFGKDWVGLHRLFPDRSRMSISTKSYSMIRAEQLEVQEVAAAEEEDEEDNEDDVEEEEEEEEEEEGKKEDEEKKDYDGGVSAIRRRLERELESTKKRLRDIEEIMNKTTAATTTKTATTTTTTTTTTKEHSVTRKRPVDERPFSCSPTKLARIDAEECTVCMNSLRSVLFQPCMHLVCCSACAKGLTECPFCRCTIALRFEGVKMP
jgi:hypothetical protein